MTTEVKKKLFGIIPIGDPIILEWMELMTIPGGGSIEDREIETLISPPGTDP